MIVNFILMFKGIEGVDKYLAKHKEYFMNKTYSKTLAFMRKYLNHEFKKRENNFVFLDYLDNSQVDSNSYPELIIKSKFYKTMTDKDKIDFIDAYLSYDGEESIINDCIDNIFDLDALKDLVTDYVTEHNASTIADKLLYIGDIDLILASNGYWYYLKDYLNDNITEWPYFTLEDIKKYLLNYSNHNDNIIKVLTSYLEKHNNLKAEVLTAIADIITTKIIAQNTESTDYMLCDSIKEYLDNIFTSLNKDALPEEDLNNLAQIIEKNNNQEVLRTWVCNTKCEYNYQILDKLMLDYDNLPYLFTALDKFYISHITTRILMASNKEEKQKFIEYLSNHYNLFSKETLDKVLFLTYTCSYHLSKKEILGFVFAGSKYTHEILEKYNFSEEERLLIFETYKNAPDIELCTLYSTYLIKGDKSALLNSEEQEKIKPLILSLKQKINTKKN